MPLCVYFYNHEFKMDYGPKDRQISLLYEGRIDPARVHFDPVEVERIDCYKLDELEELIRNGQIAFTGWFVQLLHWYQARPSELNVLRNYSRQRLLGVV